MDCIDWSVSAISMHWLGVYWLAECKHIDNALYATAYSAVVVFDLINRIILFIALIANRQRHTEKIWFHGVLHAFHK